MCSPYLRLCQGNFKGINFDVSVNYLLPKNEDKFGVSLGFFSLWIGNTHFSFSLSLVRAPNLPVTVYNDNFPQIIVCTGWRWLKDQPKRVCSIRNEYPGKGSYHLETAVSEINNGSGVFFLRRVRSLLQMVPPLRLPHLGHPKEKVMVYFSPSFVVTFLREQRNCGCPGQGIWEYRHNCHIYLSKWTFLKGELHVL